MGRRFRLILTHTTAPKPPLQDGEIEPLRVNPEPSPWARAEGLTLGVGNQRFRKS
jgi:hypothetical protein